MNEQQVDQIIDMAEAIIGGAFAADPLLNDDDAILRGRYDAAVVMALLPFHVRRSIHRMLAAAYSLGARHVLEQLQADCLGESSICYANKSPDQRDPILTEIGKLADLYEDERVDLATGEITTAPLPVPCVRCNTPCTACPDCGGSLSCQVCGPDCYTCTCMGDVRERADEGRDHV